MFARESAPEAAVVPRAVPPVVSGRAVGR